MLLKPQVQCIDLNEIITYINIPKHVQTECGTWRNYFFVFVCFLNIGKHNHPL